MLAAFLPSRRLLSMPSMRSRFASLRPMRAVAVALNSPASCLYLPSENSRLAQRQLPTAASSMWFGDGPVLVPSGSGSSASSVGKAAPKSTRNW